MEKMVYFSYTPKQDTVGVIMKDPRAKESETPWETRSRRFSHILGGNPAMKSLSAKQRISHLRGKPQKKLKGMRFVTFSPEEPTRHKKFNIHLKLTRSQIATVDFVRFEIVFPSGNTKRLDYRPTTAEKKRGVISLNGLRSGTGGDLYASARVYFKDGKVACDARLTSVFSKNPDTLSVTPRSMLVSGRAGKVEYDWDDDEFHCRAYATITNGSSVSRTFTLCKVRVTDGGENGTLISSFSFSVGPFTVGPGNSSYRSVDTWYPKGSDVWDKFNKRWDLTIKFTYVAGSVEISDSAAYRPMSTVPINLIWCDDYSSTQWNDVVDAVAMAAEILENRDVTLSNPDWRILSRKSDKDKYGIIDLDWKDGSRDYSEADDLMEDISGPDGERIDVFIPISFAYSSDTPSDKRNLNGFSPRPGPYPKDDDRDNSGLVIRYRSASTLKFGETFAHEICHYLGLPHVDTDDNLMLDSSGRSDNKLSWDQWNTIRQHGMMKWIAPDI
jgi:hypothetical protein